MDRLIDLITSKDVTNVKLGIALVDGLYTSRDEFISEFIEHLFKALSNKFEVMYIANYEIVYDIGYINCRCQIISNFYHHSKEIFTWVDCFLDDVIEVKSRLRVILIRIFKILTNDE